MNRFLFIISLLCVVSLIVKTSDDPVIGALQGTTLGTLVSKFQNGNQIIFNIAVSTAVTLGTYFVLVWIPVRNKHRRIRKSLRLQYDAFKESCVQVYLSLLNGSADHTLSRHLGDHAAFRSYFETNGQEQDRWLVVVSKLDHWAIGEIATALELFMAELQYAFSTVDIDDEEALDLMKRLDRQLYSAKHSLVQDEEKKEFFRTMWTVHTGWDHVAGLAKTDFIADAIEKI